MKFLEVVGLVASSALSFWLVASAFSHVASKGSRKDWLVKFLARYILGLMLFASIAYFKLG